MAEQVIQEIEEKIQNKKKLSPALPEEDAPVVNIRNIKMPSPPSYKVGEKVLPFFLKVCQMCFKYKTVVRSVCYSVPCHYFNYYHFFPPVLSIPVNTYCYIAMYRYPTYLDIERIY